MKSVTDFIERKIGLKVNAEKSKVGRPTHIKFLGFGCFYGSDGKCNAKPHLLSILKLKRKLKWLTKRSWSISLGRKAGEAQAACRRVGELLPNCQDENTTVNVG